jgi:glycosyltransferase involved in cell wall biosynthesis
VQRPWGGANNFIRALHRELEQSGRYVFTDSLHSDCDILFMNELGTGPGGDGRRIRFRTVRRLQAGRRAIADVLFRRKAPAPRKVVVRAVNLYSHAFRMGVRNMVIGRLRDRELLRLLNAADMVIFQSAYQRHFFVESGYEGATDLVIHNGANTAFWVDDLRQPPLEGVLRVASSTASPRPTKRHDLIAAFSEVPGVEVVHCGNWPTELNPRRVRLLGMKPASEVAEVFAGCHIFLHPAVKDPCPNAIFEAICAGLPVIYNADPGSSAEIVGPNGFALDESNLRATAETARARLPELRLLVSRNRGYYTIQRAARQYLDAFDMFAGDHHVRASSPQL